MVKLASLLEAGTRGSSEFLEKRGKEERRRKA